MLAQMKGLSKWKSKVAKISGRYDFLNLSWFSESVRRCVTIVLSERFLEIQIKMTKS